MRNRIMQMVEQVGQVEACLEALSDEERILLEELYVRQGGGNLAELMDRMGVPKTTAYRRKHRAITRISKIFDEKGVGISWDDRIENTW